MAPAIADLNKNNNHVCNKPAVAVLRSVYINGCQSQPVSPETTFIWLPEDKDGDCVEYCVVHQVVIGE